MLPRMRSAAPSQWEQNKTPICRSRAFATLFALSLSGACSVYTSDLLETTTGITAGGQDSVGTGHGGTLAGTPNAAGGKLNTDTPRGGGEGGDANGTDTPGAGTAGTPGVGGTGTAGVPGTGGSNAGSGGSGGSAGSAGNVGGTAGSGGGPVTGTGDLLDDFEDENLTIEQNDTRGGVWYPFNDGTVGTQGPSPLVCSPNSGAPADLGGYAMHITATGFTGPGTVGSGLGVDFRNLKKVYDGSKFSGIRFWAKVGATEKAKTEHRIQIADATTDEAGDKCNPAANAANGEKCNDHFGYNATFTTAWAQYSVRFDQLTQLGWGLPADALDKAALYGLQFTAKPGAQVDLWLDQIEFF
jgi:hypothetical protein